MVRTKSERPRRRNKGAPPARRTAKRPSAGTRSGTRSRTERTQPEAGTKAKPRYPNMEARREWDRQEHVRRGRAMGLTRKQAQRHADEEIQEREW